MSKGLGLPIAVLLQTVRDGAGVESVTLEQLVETCNRLNGVFSSMQISLSVAAKEDRFEFYPTPGFGPIPYKWRYEEGAWNVDTDYTKFKIGHTDDLVFFVISLCRWMPYHAAVMEKA